jgi:hypothetical protein
MILRFAQWIGAGTIVSVLLSAPAFACPMGHGQQHGHGGGMHHQQVAMHGAHGHSHGGGMACRQGQGGGHGCMHRGGAATEASPADSGEKVAEPTATPSAHVH